MSLAQLRQRCLLFNVSGESNAAVWLVGDFRRRKFSSCLTTFARRSCQKRSKIARLECVCLADCIQRKDGAGKVRLLRVARTNECTINNLQVCVINFVVSTLIQENVKILPKSFKIEIFASRLYKRLHSFAWLFCRFDVVCILRCLIFSLCYWWFNVAFSWFREVAG